MRPLSLSGELVTKDYLGDISQEPVEDSDLSMNCSKEFRFSK